MKNQTPQVQNPKEASNSPEKTRSNIALVFIIGFLAIILAVIIIGTLIKNYVIDDLKDLLLAVSSILSGPLGFIIGYYFKSKSENI